MPRINGKITAKLMKKFGPDDPGWNPPRDSSEPDGRKLPKGVEGHSVGRGSGRKKG